MIEPQDQDEPFEDYTQKPTKKGPKFQIKLPKTNLSNYIILFGCIGCALLVLFVVFILIIVAIVPPEQKDKLNELYNQEWEFRLAAFPEFSTLIQDGRYNTKFTNFSSSSIQQREKFYQQALKDIQYLRKFEKKFDTLTSKTAKLFEFMVQKNYDWYRLKLDLLGIGAVESSFFDAGPHIEIAELVSNTRFETFQDYNDYIERLSKIDSFINERISLFREAIKLKMTKPYHVIKDIPAQITNLISVPLNDSIFYEPFLYLPNNIPKPEQETLKRKGKEVLENVIVPSYTRFSQFILSEYLPACRTVGISIKDIPKGDEIYQYLVKSITTSTKSIDEIHDLGVQEVAKLRAEMKKIITDLGFTGRFYEFLESLKNNTRFFAKTQDEFMDFVRGIAKKADPELPQFFKKLPRCTYGIKPIDSFKEKNAANSEYIPPTIECTRPGYLYINTYSLSSRPKYQYESIVLNGIGHHILSAMTNELNLPNFRAIDTEYTGDFLSFTKGWNLYIEGLAPNLGFNTDPYYRFGSLGQEMLRTVRLVVDTGIHYKGWTKEQALNYTATLAPLSDIQVEQEVDRIISWPGQGLAHKIGDIKIDELLARSKERLKEKFDLREFHSVIIGEGPLTLSLLDETIESWINNK